MGWVRDDQGSVTPFALGLFGGLAVVMLLFWSAQESWATRREAQLTAEAAARAGALVEPAELRLVGSVGSGAESRARAVLVAAGYQGSVVASDREVTVVVVAPISYSFPMPGLPQQTRAEATALLVRGVDGTEE